MRIAQEPDRLNGRAIISIALFTIAATAIGVLVAWQLVESTTRSIQAPPGFQTRRTGPPPAELNSVEMSPFPPPGNGQRRRVGAPDALRSVAPIDQYGWTDRARGIVHIPIERAKQLYLSRRAHTARAAAPASEGPLP